MNTLHDMRELLLKLYNYSFIKYPLTPSEEESIVEEECVSKEEEKRYNYIWKCLEKLDENTKEDFLRLALVYYYTINYAYMLEDKDTEEKEESEDEEESDDLMNFIEEENEDTILELIEESEDIDFTDILAFIIQEDIINSYEMGKNTLDDFDEYIHLDYIKNQDENVIDIYNKLHPNLEEEYKRYSLYLKYDDIEQKFSHIVVKNPIEFAQLYSMIKQVIKYDIYLESILNDFLHNIRNNKDLTTNINIYMLKYSYIKNYLQNKDDKDNIKLEISTRLQEYQMISADTIEEFIDFDLGKYLTMLTMLSKEEKDELNDLINLDNLKNYGNEGIWKKYTKEQNKYLCKYSPLWLDRLDTYNELYDIEIYYSIDASGEYTIPRLCSFIKDNKFMSVVGRRNGLNIELDLLNILEDKIKEYNYENIITSDLSTLKYIKYLSNKINNNISLTNEEFEFIYGIGKDNSYFIFGKHDSKVEELRINPNERKMFAEYYGCLEEEVALNQSEFNENTVVTKFFFPQKSNCNYPKLRVIFGNAYCDYIESAKGLSSLEYVKYDASFSKLVSSEGLSNLKYIGGNAFFPNLEDTSYLNDNIEIKGTSFFKDGYEPNNIIKEK